MQTGKNIVTQEDLKEAIKEDAQDHEIKELAILLAAAMRDWPNAHPVKIEYFIRQFKAFHCVNHRPLDLDRLKLNKFAFGRDLNLWRLEAHSYIKQMMERSVAAYGISDLDWIVYRIVNYYRTMPNTPRIRADQNLSLARSKKSEDPTLALRIADYVRLRQEESVAAEALMREIIADRQNLFYRIVWRGHDDHVISIDFSPNGRELVTTSFEICRWQIDSQLLFTEKWRALCARFSPSGKDILSGNDGEAVLLDLEGKEQMRLLKGERFLVTSVAFSPDGNLLLTGARGGGAHLFDRQGKEILSARDGARKVFSVAFHPDNRHFLTADQDFKATLWSTAGERTQDFIGHKSIIFAVVVSPDGRWVLTGSRDKTVRLWDLQGREHLQIPVGNRSVWSTHSMAFAPDSRSFVASGLHDIAVWCDLSGRKIADLPVEGGCNAVAFSPDGKFIASGGWDGFVRLWPTRSREENGLEIDTFLDKYVYDFSPTELAGKGVLLEPEE